MCIETIEGIKIAQQLSASWCKIFLPLIKIPIPVSICCAREKNWKNIYYLGVSLSKLSSLTSFSPSGPVHSQEPFGHRMINDRIFLSVALSGKVSYEQRQAERRDHKNNFMNKKNN